MATDPNTRFTGEIGVDPELAYIKRKTLLLNKIEDILKKRYPNPKETAIYKKALEKNLQELEEFLKNLSEVERKKQEEEHEQQYLSQIGQMLASLLKKNPTDQRIQGVLQEYEGKGTLHLQKFIEQITLFNSLKESIPLYIKTVLYHKDSHHLDAEQIFQIQTFLDTLLNVDLLINAFLQNPGNTCQQLETIQDDINRTIEEAQNHHLREKISQKIENWNDPHAKIAPDNAKELVSLLEEFKDGVTTHSGLFRLDSLLHRISPEEGDDSIELLFSEDGEPVEDIIKKFQENKAEALSPDETAEHHIIEYTPETPEEGRKIKIYEALGNRQKIEQTVALENWQRYDEISEICDQFTNGERTKRLKNISFPGGQHYFVLLRVDNPFFNLNLSPEEFEKLTPDTQEMYERMKDEEVLTFFKAQFSSSKDIPTSPTKGIPTNCHPQLQAYIRYKRFDIGTGKEEELFEELALEEKSPERSRDREPNFEWVFGRSSFDIERTNALLFLENGWEELNGDGLTWTKQNIYLGETPSPCVSIVSLPLTSTGGIKKRFIRFTHYPRHKQDINETQLAKIGGTIEHFFAKSELQLQKSEPNLQFQATKTLIPVEGLVGSNGEEFLIPKDIDTNLPEYEMYLVSKRWNEVSYETLERIRKPGNYLSDSNRFVYFNLIIVTENDTPKYYVQFSRDPEDITTAETKLNELGTSYQSFVSELEKTYQNETQACYTLRDEEHPDNAVEASVYSFLQPVGFARCPEQIYSKWMGQDNRQKERVAEIFPDGTHLTVIKAQNPRDQNENWIFVRGDKTPVDLKLPVTCKVNNYSIEQFLLSRRDGTILLKSEQRKVERIDLNAEPERIAREQQEKEMRERGRKIQKLLDEQLPPMREKIERLKVLKKNKVPENIQVSIENVKIFATKGNVEETGKAILHLDLLLNEYLAEEEKNVISVQPLPEQKETKPKKQKLPKFWNTPLNEWMRKKSTRIAATVLSIFQAVASPFVPALRKPSHEDTTTAAATRLVVEPEGPQSLYETRFAEEEKQQRQPLKMPASETASQRRDVSVDVPNLPVAETAPDTVNEAVTEPTPPQQEFPQVTPPQIEKAPTQGPKAEILKIKKGDRVISIITRHILSQDKEGKLDPHQVRQAVSRKALEGTALNHIYVGENVNFEYTVTPENTVVLNSIIVSRPEVQTQPPQVEKTETKPTPVEQVSPAAQTIELGNNTYEIGKPLEYLPLASKPGLYTLVGTSKDGTKVFLKSADNPKAPQFAVDTKNITSRILSPETEKFTIDGLRIEVLPGDAYNVHFTTLSGKGVIEALATLILHTDFADNKEKWGAAMIQANDAVKAADKAGHITDTNNIEVEYDEIPDLVVSTDSVVFAKKNNTWTIESGHFARGKAKKIIY